MGFMNSVFMYMHILKGTQVPTPFCSENTNGITAWDFKDVKVQKRKGGVGDKFPLASLFSIFCFHFTLKDPEKIQVEV